MVSPYSLLTFIIITNIKKVFSELAYGSETTLIDYSDSGQHLSVIKLNNGSNLIFTTDKYYLYSDYFVRLSEQSHGLIFDSSTPVTLTQLSTSLIGIANYGSFWTFNIDTNEKKIENSISSPISSSSFISLSALDEKPVIAYSTNGNAQVLLLGDDGSTEATATISNVDSNIIQCLTFSSKSNKILCFTINSKNIRETHYHILTINDDKTVSTISNNIYYVKLEPKSSNDCKGLKAVTMELTYFLLCLVKLVNSNYSLYCVIGNFNSDTSITKTVSKEYQAINPCSRTSINHYGIAALNAKLFAIVCRKYNEDSVMVMSILKISDSGEISSNFFQRGINRYDSNTSIKCSVSNFGLIHLKNIDIDNAFALFYNNNGVENKFGNYFEIPNYPTCDDIIIGEVFPGDSGEISFKDKIHRSYDLKDTVFDPNKRIKITPKDVYNDKSPIDLTYGSATVTESMELEEDDVVNYNVQYSASGQIVYTFGGYVIGSPTVQFCRIVFQVKSCYKNCLGCSEEGTKDDMKCSVCNNDDGYFMLPNTNNCIHKSDINLENYYFSEINQEFLPCDTSCTKCVDGQSCTECASSYYPVNDPDNTHICYKKNDTLNYFYFNEKKNYFSRCYESCLTCNGEGTESQHNCITCETKYYNLEGKTELCYNETTKPNNYFGPVDQEFKKCYVGCYSCNELGDDKSSKCVKCNTQSGYYQLEDDSTNCTLSSGSIPGYFFDIKNKYFAKCYTGCKKCSELGTSATDTKCEECDNEAGYYSVEGQSGRCTKKNEKVSGYVFDTNGFYKCDKSCAECTGLKDKDDTKCVKCSEFYASLIDSPSRCIEKTSNIDGYYYNSTNKVFEICNKACSTCNGYGTAEEPNCSKCAQNYYYMYDDKTKCYSKAPNSSYTIDTTEGYIFKCHEACIGCTRPGTFENTNCINCDNSKNYFPLYSDHSKCYKESTKPDGTFFNGNYYIKCYDTCLTCDITGDETDHKCLQCDLTNYFPIVGVSGMCINDNLPIRQQQYNNYYRSYRKQYEKCNYECETCQGSSKKCLTCNTQAGYYLVENTNFCYEKDKKYNYYFFDTSQNIFRKCYETCLQCSDVGTVDNQNCQSCIEGYLMNPYKSNQCERICEKYFFIDLSNNDKYTCTEKCPEGYEYIATSSKECLTQCPTNTFQFEKMCYDECPSGTTVDSTGVNCEVVENCVKEEFETESDAETIEKKISNMAKTYCLEYVYTNKKVNIIKSKTNQFMMTIFKDEKCSNDLTDDVDTNLTMSNCASILREKYGIPSDIPFTIVKFTMPREGQTDQLSYLFFDSRNGNKLDVSFCSNEKTNVKVDISTTKGVNITEAKEFEGLGVDVYNSMDPFFNDVCIPFSVDGKDIPLEERRKYYYQNVSFCEEGCEYEGVNLTTEEAECSCEVKTSIITDIFDNPLTGEFLELLQTANFEVMSCFKEVFSFKNFHSLWGSWIIVGLTLIQLGFLILFIKTGIMSVRIELAKWMGSNPPKKDKEKEASSLQGEPMEKEAFPETLIYEEGKEMNSSKTLSSKRSKKDSIPSEQNVSELLEENKQNLEPDIIDEKEELSQIKIKKPSIKNRKESDLLSIQSTKIFTPASKALPRQNKKVMVMVLNKSLDGEKSVHSSSLSANSDIKLYSDSFSTKRFLKEDSPSLPTICPNEKEDINPVNFIIHDSNKRIKKFQVKKTFSDKPSVTHHSTIDSEVEEEFDDDELNGLDLYDAIKYDHRSFWQFYLEQICEKQTIINIFFIKEPLEPFSVKAISFFFGIALYFTLNGLFYTESYISEQLESGSSFNFLYLLKNELSRCLYSMIMGMCVETMIGCVISSSSNRIQFLMKRERDINRFREESIKISKGLMHKCIGYLIVNFILMIVFWYYVTAFCYCYPNSQLGWLIGGVFTWIITQLFPFPYCLLITALRFIGIKFKIELFYRLSTCLSD